MKKRTERDAAAELRSAKFWFQGPFEPILYRILRRTLDATKKAPEPIRRILWGVRCDDEH
jgi:hypothetical protein